MPRKLTGLATADKGALHWLTVEARPDADGNFQPVAVTGQFEFQDLDGDGNVREAEDSPVAGFGMSKALAGKFARLFEDLALEIVASKIEPASGNELAKNGRRFVERKKGARA